MADFFHMGGFAAFVWPAYLVSLVVFCVLGYAIWRRRTRLQQQLDDIRKHDKDEPSTKKTLSEVNY